MNPDWRVVSSYHILRMHASTVLRELMLVVPTSLFVFFGSASSIVRSADEDEFVAGRRHVAALMAQVDAWTIEGRFHYPPPGSRDPRAVSACCAANGRLALSIVERLSDKQRVREVSVKGGTKQELLETFFDGLAEFQMSDHGRGEDGVNAGMQITVGTGTVVIKDLGMLREEQSCANQFIGIVRKAVAGQPETVKP